MKKVFEQARVGPVKRFSGIQVITSPYGRRVRNGEVEFHPGIDLRSVRFNRGKGYVNQWQLQDILAVEEMEILKYYISKRGNFIINAKGTNSDYEFEYIHVVPNSKARIRGAVFEKGEVIGKTRVRPGFDTHLHFGVLHVGQRINPEDYLKGQKRMK